MGQQPIYFQGKSKMSNANGIFIKGKNPGEKLFSLSQGNVTSSTVAGAISLQITTTNTTCGYSNGTILVVPSNGTAPYSFSENSYPFQTAGAFIGLAAGTYLITVMDANGLTQTATVILTNTFSPPSINVSSYTNIATCGGSEGSVTLAAGLGTPPYTYSMDNVIFQNSNVFSNLPAGNYSFFVRDANGCTEPLSFDMSNLCLNFGYTYTQYVCTNEGEINIFYVGGGSPPYTFSIDGTNFQTSGDFINLTPGIYYVSIKDATGIKVKYGFSIFRYCPVTVIASATDASCGNNDGTITLLAGNGVGPYLYSLDGISFQIANSFSGLAPGNYTITVKDFNGGLGILNNVVIGTNCPLVSVTAASDTCNQSIGSLRAAGTNGVPPYQYAIDGINFQTSNIFLNLKQGNYLVTIRDNSGNENTTSITLDNICPNISVTISNTTCGKNNGSITATGSSGFPPYTFSLDGINYQGSNIFLNLTPGNYTVWAKDIKGLTVSTTAQISASTSPMLSSTITAATCNNNDGQITSLASGGIAPLEYSMDGINFQNGNIFSALAAGNYTIAVRDNNGCVTSIPAVLPMINNLVAHAGVDTTICEGTSFSLAGSSNAVNYSWTPATALNNSSIPNPVAAPVQTTQYTLTVSTLYCSASDMVNITVLKAPLPDPGPDVAVCYGKDVQLNGTGGIQYQWSPSSGLSDPNIPDPIVISPKESGTYFLSVIDGMGCKSISSIPVTITVTATAKLWAGNDSSVSRNQPVQLQAVDVNHSGFTEYTWSPGTFLNNSSIPDPVSTPTNDITYTVTATAPGGCEGIATIHIKVYAGPAIYVPNAFTPNNDSHNDILRAIPIGIREFKFLRIFNRWGQLVFQTSDPGIGWDGNLNGQPQVSGGFVWMVEGVDFQGNTIQGKGTVLLIR